MNSDYYNNIGFGVITLGSVLNKSQKISISKLFLILPLLSHQELLQYLSRKTTVVVSIEKLIVERISFFTNFNKRYYASLCLTINALQYLNDLGYVKIENSNVTLLNSFNYDSDMGKRADKVFLASSNVSQLLKDRVDKLYMNLRVEI